MGSLPCETSVHIDWKSEPIFIAPTAIEKLEPYARTGGLGDVWKCSMSTPLGNHHVAVKAVRVPDANDKEKLSKIAWRIRREAYVWMKLLHNHILPFKGISDGFGPLPALVSLWMENGSLNEYLKNSFSQLSDCRKLTLVQQVAAGLCYLHGEDIVHGDLTGTNILIDASGNIRLGDFGLSMIAAESANQTFGSVQTGSTRWMAPEFLDYPEDFESDSSPLKPTKTGDVYSFGCVMLQIFSGKEPYSWINDAIHVIPAILRGGTRFRSAEKINMNEGCRLLSSRCLSKDPAKRPSVVEITSEVGQ